MPRTLPAAGDRLDAIGVVLATACAVHCVITPALIALLPLTAVAILAGERLEWALAGVSIALGLATLAHGRLRRYRSWQPLLLFFAGAALLVVARLYADDGHPLEVGVVIAGAGLIAAAHLVNRALCRRCVV